jgi:hydroxyacylglutathione hydrolase
MPEVITVPAFSDNYLWLIAANGKALAVDPGDAGAIRTALRDHGLQLVGILVTHHHADHIGGIPGLLADSPVPVYGPAGEMARIPSIDHPVGDGDTIEFAELGLQFSVIAVPGHTLGHIAYYCTGQNWLFCGDTLFASGCGRLFEGTPAQMHASLQRLIALPDSTKVFCAHEYTMSNLAFARAIEPERLALAEETARVAALRATGRPSVPTSVGHERQFNPFLRVEVAEVKKAAESAAGRELSDPVAVFAALRTWKDNFRI